MKDKQTTSLLAAILVVAAGVFLIDLQVQLGYATWLPYNVVVLLSLWFARRWQTYATVAACTVLTILGLFLSPRAGFFSMDLVNRLFGIVAFWVVAFLGLAVRRNLALEKANTRLQQEMAERLRGEERLVEQASLLDLAHDAIMVRDLGERIVYWNRGAERLYGWTAAEALNRNALEVLYPSDLSPLTEARQQLLAKGDWAGETRQVTKAGRQIVVETRWTLVRDPEGRPKCVLVVNTDVTERSKLQAQLLRTQRLESMGVLAGGVAHDFNNLLTPILMAVKLLREERPEEERQHLLGTLQASAERGAEVVQQLLSFAGGSDGERGTVQPRHVIKEIKSILDHTFSKAIQIEMRLDDNLTPLCADATQLSQVLMNLCVNARDAMPDGGTLTIRAENVVLSPDHASWHADARPGPYVRITVEDTGAGIPADVLDRIFDPFFTTKEHGKGTGLGLSTVLGIVKSHGGFIHLDSEPGRGCRFTVYLPAGALAEGKQASLTHLEPQRGQGELILLVDDEPFILETARATLETHGYRVLTAADGNEALLAYRQHPGEMQAVLLDMMMPGMDGPTTLAALQQLDSHARIIATSGLRVTGALAEAVAAGETPFLQKPYTDEQLLATLARTLQAP